MGEFRVTLVGTGNHGCNREKKDGEFVVGCELPGCIDCIIRECVRRLKRTHARMDRADLIHFPDTDYKVLDDLLAGVRVGEFR